MPGPAVYDSLAPLARPTSNCTARVRTIQCAVLCQAMIAQASASAAGTLMTSFYLVLWFDVDQILCGLCAVSSILGGLGLVVPEREHALA